MKTKLSPALQQEAMLKGETPRQRTSEKINSLNNRINQLSRELKIELERSTHYYDKWQNSEAHINRLVMAGDALLGSSHCTDYHEKVAEWNQAKRIKL